MPNFSFVPLGVGDAFSACYYSSCLLLEAGEEKLLVDCPHPIRKILREASFQLGQTVEIETISAILLSHLHADHCSGLEGFAFYNCYARKDKQKTVLLAHPEVQKNLWKGHLAGGMGHLSEDGSTTRDFSDFFDWKPLSFTTRTTFGSFEIECRLTIHSIPTTAFRIHVGNLCLGYSTDTAFDPTLIDWLAEADCIIHETNVGPHTPYEKLLSLPKELRDKMYLIHYPDSFSLRDSEIEPLVQGKRYFVG